MEKIEIRKIFIAVMAGLLLVGVLFRVWGITDNDFVFYDEGYYLDWNRPLGDAIARHGLKDAGEVGKAVFAYVSRSLSSGKSLWFMLADTRIFWGGVEIWSWARVLSAGLGLLTIVMTFLFARRFFGNLPVAILAAALLAVMPGHVFYSRIGMQESLSAFLVLGGFYFYMYPAKWTPRVLLSGLFWGLAFFSNYRLIMLPFLITLSEAFLAFSQKRAFDLRKWLWAVLVFFGCVFGIGNFNGGYNTVVIFSWIFHQAELAEAQRHWINLFSYPYYLFRMENALFAIVFFLNGYLLYRKEWKYLLPFWIALVLMGVFSLASEKGARYLAVGYPFAAMAVAGGLAWGWERFASLAWRRFLVIFVSIMILMMGARSWELVKSRSQYRDAAEFLLRHDVNAKILSTQPYVHRLYFNDTERVRPVPGRFEVLLRDYSQGYRYLLLCPQAYISLTESQKRFDRNLYGYLGFINARVPPRMVFKHFDQVLLERFVFEHNEYLPRSIEFLKKAQEIGAGSLRIYDLGEVLPPMLDAAARYSSSEDKGPTP